MPKKVRTPGDYTKNIGNANPANRMQSFTRKTNLMEQATRVNPRSSQINVPVAKDKKVNTRKVLEDAFRKNRK